MTSLLQAHSGLQSDAGFRRKDYDTLPPAYSFTLMAYPALSIGRDDLEIGNKVLLPPDILQKLSTYQLPEPLLFSVQNTVLGNSTNVGVLEFSSESGVIILPDWLFMQLNLDYGVEVNIQPLLRVPKGLFMVLQPHETEFMKLADPKAILERNLSSNYICATKGDILNIRVMDRVYLFNILEVKPQVQSNCICLIDTDIKVEFETPLDYKEKSKQPFKYEVVHDKDDKEEYKEMGPFSGKGFKVNGQTVDEEEITIGSSSYDPRKHRLVNGVLSIKDIQENGRMMGVDRGPIVGGTRPKKTPK